MVSRDSSVSPETMSCVPRLPLEEKSLTLASVTELVKDMQKEHEAQLAKERELVVQQVLESLETKGLLKKAQRRSHKKPTKLDRRLQSLLSHSLSDSGLQYPHVIPSEQPRTPHESTSIRPLVLERKEETDQPVDARRVRTRQERRRRHENEVGVIADETEQVEEKQEEVEPLLVRSKRSSKMDKKTWVILEQSKKLLQDTKSSGYKPGIIAPKLHLAKEDHKYDPAEPTEPSVLAEETSVTTEERKENSEDATTNAPDDVEKVDQQDSNAYQMSLLEPFPTSYATENSDKAWENELARQILSMYATSMASKKKEHQKSNNASSPTLSPETKRTARPTNKLPALDADRKKRIQHIQDSWQPSHIENGKVVLCMPKIPKPIWFAGTGIVMATWCALAVPSTEAKLNNVQSVEGASTEGLLCKHKLCNELRELEQQFELEQYLAIVETLMTSRVRAYLGASIDELDLKLWKQLVITANAFASRAIDNKKYPLALSLAKKTESILDDSSLLVGNVRTELLAYIADTYAYYYYSRNKANAGMNYISKAHAVHAKHAEWSHLAKCKLHMATLQSKLQQHDQAIAQLELILALVEDAKLEEDGGGGASAQKLCLVAVCYNNLALEQLHLKDVDGAATSSQNARRLARLCLSYSNRWLSQFEATHRAVIRAMASIMGDQNDLDMQLVMKYDIEA
ncbi:hypothetical protein Ae201684_003207 [Aphanomyces euteiches]|uniref:Uncharacterized protein n=1 Tax=Aphanomyces euteiches TaxID=100861 RepID=A0A6G0XM33_9STRA|nr:hypothetical protein Ae201684_003207 [Aphanomyces euteiches]